MPRNRIAKPGPRRLALALGMAAGLHAGQVRKGTKIPYLAHLLAVAALVIEHGGDEDEAIAALLHDAVEDAGGRPVLARIRRAFGARVAAIVEECTDAFATPKPPWRRRKEGYLAALPFKSESARLVGCADKLHNARAILADYRALGEPVWQRFNGGRAGTLWYYRALADAFVEAGPRPLARALDATVRAIERRAGRKHRRRRRKPAPSRGRRSALLNRGNTLREHFGIPRRESRSARSTARSEAAE